jgi:dipeptidyl aminopeptidase/acylaminoacyl peptidase
MPKKQPLPYGLWPSRITPELIGDILELSEPCWDESGALFWMERRSNRSSICRYDPVSQKIRSVSGEYQPGGSILYGGGSYHVRDGELVFVDKKTGQLHHISHSGNEIDHLSSTCIRAASPRISPDGKFLIYLHSDGENDQILSRDLAGSREPTPLISGSDFYNFIRWHPNGKQIAWVSWDHPHLPWDSSILYLGEVNLADPAGEELVSKHILAGKAGVSVLQPEFSPDGSQLTYISDESGWWQLYLHDLNTGNTQQLTAEEAEHGLPAWVQDQRTYSFSPGGQKIHFLRNQAGFCSLWSLDLNNFRETRINLDESYTWLESLSVSPRSGEIALVASAGDLLPRLIIVKPDGRTSIIREAAPREIPRELFSRPEPISWVGDDGERVEGLFYIPHNPACTGNGKPPLLVIIHSGPTRQKCAEFQPRTQYFTSRGYAVLEVNYRGSTGYGREYWEALKGQWGVLDVEDVYSSALALSREGLVDKKRIALLGSSSGGLTVLQLLVRYPGFFKAGISLYGVTNLQDLLKDPTKFERYYHNWLVGDPEKDAAEYIARSPLFSADKIRAPIAIFQGGKDPIVPREQAEQIVEALKRNSIPHEFYLYPEEGHGFKKKENVADFYLKSELFLQKYLL